MPAPSPIAWDDVEDAIYDWFVAATGLATIWSEQDAPQPPYPYASLNITSGPTKVAGLDETRTTYDVGQLLGQEIGIETAGLREITLSCQIHARQLDATPANHPRNLMSRAQSSLGMESFLSGLRVAGLSVIEEGPVQNVSEVVEDTWITRAMMDVRFGLAASVEERVGYIKDTEVKPILKKPDGTTMVDDDLLEKFTVVGP